MADLAPAGVELVAKNFNEFERRLKEATRLVGGLNDATRGVSGVSDRFQRSNRGLLGSLGRLGRGALSFGSDLTVVGFGIERLIDGSARAVGAGVELTTSFEDAFAGVAKTVDGLAEVTPDGLLTATQAGKDFQDTIDAVNDEIPITTEELLRISQIGGQLGLVEGLEAEETSRILASFAEDIGRISVATGLSQEELSLALAQISNIFSEEVTELGGIELNIERLGDTLVELGNKTQTTETQIINFSKRLSPAAVQVGLTQAETLGLAAALGSTGINAEAGASAASRALLTLQEAALDSNQGFIDNTEQIGNLQDKLIDLNADLVRLEAQTGLSGESLVKQKEEFIAAGGAAEDFGRQLGDTRREKLFKVQESVNELTGELENLRAEQGKPFSGEALTTFARVAGTSTEEFKKMVDEAPIEAFLLFIDGLEDLGPDAAVALDDLGLGGVRATQALLGLAGSGDLAREAIGLAQDEFATGGATAEETGKFFATLSSRIQIATNRFRSAGAEILDNFRPALIGLVNTGGEIASVFGDRLPGILDTVGEKLDPIADLISERLGLEDFDPVQAVKDAFTDLESFLDTVDLQPTADAINTFLDNAMVPLNAAFQFYSDNKLIIEGAIEGIGIALLVAFGSQVLIAGITAIGTGLAALLSPIGLLVVAGAGLGAAWNTNFLGIRDITMSVKDDVIMFLGNMKTTFDDTVKGFEEGGLKGALEALAIPQEAIDSITSFADAFTVELSEAVSGIGSAFSGLLSTVQTFAQGESPQIIMDFLGSIFGGVSDFDSENAASIGTFLGNLASIPLEGIENLLGVLDGLVQIFDGLVSGNDELVESGVLDLGTSLVDGILTPLGGLVEGLTGFDIIQPVKDFAANFIQGIQDSGLTSTLEELGVPTAVLNSIERLKENFQPIIDETIPRLQESFSNFTTKLSELGTMLAQDENFQFLVTNLGELAKILASIAGIVVFSAFDLLANGLIILADVIINQAANVLDFITGFSEAVAGIVALDSELVGLGVFDIGTSIVNGITEPLDAILGTDISTPINEALENSKEGIIEGVTVLIGAITDPFGAMFTLIEFSKPTFESVKTFFSELKTDLVETFTGFFSGIDFEFPSLADILPEGALEVFKFLGVDIGDEVAEGIKDGQSTAEEAVTEMALHLPLAFKEATGQESPDPAFQEIGRNYGLGLQLGLEESLTPAIDNTVLKVNEFIIALANLVPTIEIVINDGLIPLSFAFTGLTDFVLTGLVDKINNEVIPSKLEIANVTTATLIPAIESLMITKNLLIAVLDALIIRFKNLVVEQKNAKRAAEDLKEPIIELAKAYERLAKAAKEASRAGTPSGPGTGGPGPGIVPGAQGGANFIVPGSIPPAIQGPTGGMLLEVHPGEFVKVVPASQVSGAGVQNIINNNTNRGGDSFHMHLQEAPTQDLRDSFDLLRAFG